MHLKNFFNKRDRKVSATWKVFCISMQSPYSFYWNGAYCEETGLAAVQGPDTLKYSILAPTTVTTSQALVALTQGNAMHRGKGCPSLLGILFRSVYNI